MRKKIIIASASAAAFFAVIGVILQAVISYIPRELTEYGSSSRWGADTYAHICVYMTNDAGFDAYSMLKAKSDIESAYTSDSIDLTSALYSVSSETNITVSAVNSKRYANCNATVYIGDYFRFHNFPITEGAHPTDSDAVTDSVMIDENAAWQIFGTKNGVTGMEVMIGDYSYIVSGVTKSPGGVYDEVYGDSPRIYLRDDSSYMRQRKTCFTSFEGMLPDPITNYAENTLENIFSGYNAVIRNIDTRFQGKSLSEMRDGTVKMITESSDTEYPFTEKAMLILTLKAAGIYSAMRIMYGIALVFLAVLFFAVYGPVVRFIEKMLSKLKF